MSDPPRERRRRGRPAPDDESAPEVVETKPAPRAPAKDADSGGGAGRALAATRHHPVWPLVAGLGLGFAAGREAYRFGLGDGSRGASAQDGNASAFIAVESTKGAYATVAEFPAGWLKEGDIGNATLLTGLSEPQKVTVLQALNERNCECGCGMGSLAVCLKKDPNCPRSPMMAKLAVDMAKQGKGLKEIEDAIDAKQKELSSGQKPAAAAPEPPSTPRPVELAAWNPRKGPKAAKVTIVEFSDFQ
jgi:hypothetical protein